MKKNKVEYHKSYYNITLEDLESEFNTDLKNGLNIEDLDTKYKIHGYNEIPKVKKSQWQVYIAPLFNSLIIVLLITAVIVSWLGEPESSIILIIMLIINSLAVILQNKRAQKVLNSLRNRSMLSSLVLRDGLKFEIPNKELLPGDLILLNSGNKVPADARLIEANNLSVDEASLTGESVPVEKIAKKLSGKSISLTNRSNMIYMGTFIKTGNALALVVGTGINTEMGKITEELNELNSFDNLALTKKLNRLGLVLGIIVIITLIFLIIFKLSFLLVQDKMTEPEIKEAVDSSILRAVGLLPINLPLLCTLVLITGVLYLAQQGVIVKNLSSIETLGRISVICSDKTGTITKNEMTVERIWINKMEYEITGSGYDEDGNVLFHGQKVNFNQDPTVSHFIDSIVLNNTVNLLYKDVKIRISGKLTEKAVRFTVGSPIEAALLVLVEKIGYLPYDIKKKYEKIKEYSFSSELKKMSSLCKLKEKAEYKYIFTKGAPEVILKLSKNIEIHGKLHELTTSLKDEITQLINDRTNKGYRTLAIAYKSINELKNEPREEVEKDLTFLALVSMIDPPRTEVKKSIKSCQMGGIKVVMITGDHLNTAKTIAKNSGIWQQGDLVVEGTRLNDLSNEDYKKISVFGRLKPNDKETIVNKYQKQDNICAMTGDGINDSLAMKVADASIALGISGTDVAKETADIIISDDNFISIENGVKIGRSLFSKIRVIVYFFICINLAEGFIFFMYEIYPFFTLFTSEWQHVYIYGIVHSLPALALVLDKFPKDIMKDPPRKNEEILSSAMWKMLLINAIFIVLGLFLVLQFSLMSIIPLNEWNLNPQLSFIPKNSTYQNLIEQKARTMFITTIYLIETSFIWSFRRPNKYLYQSLRKDFSLDVLVICLFTLGIHVLVINFSYYLNSILNYVYDFNINLNLMFLSLKDWIICIIFSLPAIFGIEIYKYLAKRKNIFF